MQGMMNRKTALLLLLSFCFFVAVSDHAQVIPQGTSGWAGNSELRVVGGYSPRSNVGIGVTQHRKLIFTAIEYAHPIGYIRHTSVSYYGGIVPFAAVHKPAEMIAGTAYPAAWNWAIGAEPLGFAFNFRTNASVQPFLDSAAGLLYFNEQVPIAGSSQFNFMFHFGAGLEFYRNGGHFLTVGFRYHHISNAQTGHFNPGIDSDLIYVAVPIWRRIKTH